MSENGINQEGWEGRKEKSSEGNRPIQSTAPAHASKVKHLEKIKFLPFPFFFYFQDIWEIILNDRGFPDLWCRGPLGNQAELKFSMPEMRREKSIYLFLQKVSAYKMIFPGSQIEVVHRGRLGSTDNSITSQAVRSAMLGPSLIREHQQIQDPRASETKRNRQIRKVS